MNNIYATLLSSDSYLSGVLGLNYSLIRSKSTYKLLVIATDNLSLNAFKILEQNNINYIIKPYLLYKTNGFWRGTINKFHIFSLLEYSKICFLDADIIIL